MEQNNLLDWFDPEELQPCDHCGERAGLRIEGTGTFICFGCGYIRWTGGETSVAAIQARHAAPK
jgi:hypothetical protein